MKAIIGVHEFISTGSVLLNKGERAQIFPFDGSEYSFFLRISVDMTVTDNGDWKTNTDVVPMEVHITRPWVAGSNVLSYGVGVAQTEKELFYMCLNSHVFGDNVDHLIFANYAIYKRNK
ncbi:hypothetical protein LOK46_25560 [Methylobacterium sp. NMS14P]|uniref:hypothetical protein n=1 Tax=Methylobacterium sp. NMS14P TaxID=2894310 RepID=UPI00235A10C0|nr:hypothetical protein [Methylobacterium sp. NMS14P]WCS24462.1 hypothetical protein LOK46_25560 [Methylobacterium sp. NMS14P]